MALQYTFRRQNYKNKKWRRQPVKINTGDAIKKLRQEAGLTQGAYGFGGLVFVFTRIYWNFIQPNKSF